MKNAKLNFLALGIDTPQLFNTSNVMGAFDLLFDVAIDISMGKFISGNSGHMHYTNIPR